jgi:diaminopimelate epimerase
VQARGGLLTVEWAGLRPASPDAAANLTAPVMLTGPAATVYQGSIDVPDNLA